MAGLNGKVALVTGGGSGIGRAVVEGMVGEGAKVRVNGVAPGGTATEIRGLKSLDQEEPMLASPKMREGLKSINPLQLEIEPEDHVGAYLYLANEELSRSVTGVVINSDGGIGARGLTKVAGLL